MNFREQTGGIVGGQWDWAEEARRNKGKGSEDRSWCRGKLVEYTISYEMGAIEPNAHDC
jgi:hypothetical protein